MSDYDFPELPSDEELGITEEDREKYGEDLPDDGPELSDDELAALLGGSAGPPSASGAAPAAGAAAAEAQSDARAKAARQVRKAEKKQTKDEARASKEARKEEKARARAEKKEARKARAAERKAAAQVETAVPAWRGPVTLLALVLFAAVASTRTGLPGPVPANAPDTVFSSARAMTTLVEMARLPHPPGSPEHDRVRALLVDQLTELGFEPEIQTTTSLLPSRPARSPDADTRPADFVRAATVRNIVARRPGTASTGTVLFTAHYDSREIAVGAGDDGTGVVAILEALRAHDAAGEPMRNDLIVLFTDAEELGLLGARAFVDQHRWMADVDAVVSFEMRGGGGPSIMFETNDLQGAMVRTAAGFDPGPYANSMAYEVYKRMPNDTDFTPFREAGVQGLNFAAIDNANVYHQTFDTPDEVSEATLQHHGENALDALRAFGSMDLGSVNAPNRAYFALPGLGVVHYPAPAVHAVSALLLVLFALFVALARRGGARPAAMGGGLLVVLLAGAAVWLAAGALMDRLPGFHPEAGALHGSVFHSEGWYVLAMAWAALAVFAVATVVARRWITRDELAVGALALPALSAVVVGVAAPLAAMNLQWPVIAGLSACIALLLLGGRASGTAGWIASLVLALPVVLFIVPLVELVWLALTLRLAGAISVLMVIGLVLALPALAALRTPNAWWAPALSLVLAAASTGIGLWSARPGPSSPIPTTLAWAYEHGSGEALWVTGPVEEEDEGASSADEGRLWAEARAGGSFGETRDLAGFGYPFGVVPVRRAAVASAQPPEVEVTLDSIAGSERTVELRVRSRIGAERLGFVFEGGTRMRALNGVPVQNADAVGMADHWGTPEESVTLRLTMPAQEAIGVQVLEHLLRPEEILGDGAFDRPAEMAPNINRMSDRAMLRYSVAAFSDPRHSLLRPGAVADSAAATDTVSIPDTSSVSDTVLLPDTSSLPDTASPADTVSLPDTTISADTVNPADSAAVPDSGAVGRAP